MPTYIVRLKEEYARARGMGAMAIVTAATDYDLFWTVEQFDNPFSYEYKRAKSCIGIMIDYSLPDPHFTIPPDISMAETKALKNIQFRCDQKYGLEVISERLHMEAINQTKGWKPIPDTYAKFRRSANDTLH